MMTGKRESKAQNSEYEIDPTGENTFWKKEKDSKNMVTKHWQAPKWQGGGEKKVRKHLIALHDVT